MSQHFTMSKLVRFTAPSVGMMVLMSLYVMADGFFVSNFCGATALAAVNFAYPIALLLGTVGYMLGPGGAAVVAKTRGEGDDARANRQFSLFVYVSIAAGIVFTAVGLAALEPLLVAFGATGEMLDDCMAYGIILVCGVSFDILQFFFQAFLPVAGKPGMGFGVTVAAGLTNVALDALLIVGFGMGVEGAAIGTVASMAVGGVIPLVYFSLPNKSPLRLGRTSMDWRVLGHACANGSSEMVSNLAMSIVAIVYNVQLLAYLGEPGVAAYSVIAYVSFAFAAVFLGYATGSSPLMSYQYGAKNQAEMQNLFKKSLVIVGACGIVMFAATRVLAAPLASVFVGYDVSLEELTVHAFGLYSLAFLIMGFNVYGSALFTSLGNGLVSAIISFVRSFVCEIGAVMLLPMAIGPDGIWLSVVVAELVALVMTGVFTIKLGNVYGYLPERLKE